MSKSITFTSISTFRDELKAMEATGFLKLFTAFSRDQQEKMFVLERLLVFRLTHSFGYFFVRYVQHKIREQSSLLNDLIKTKCGTFMVAGSSKDMPNAVKEALQIALDVDANYIEELVRTGRYQEETWS